MTTLGKLFSCGCDTAQLVIAWLILWSFAFTALPEARIIIAGVTCAQIGLALTGGILFTVVLKKPLDVSKRFMHGASDPVLCGTVVLWMVLMELPGLLLHTHNTENTTLNFVILNVTNSPLYFKSPKVTTPLEISHPLHDKFIVYGILALPPLLRIVQNKYEMASRSFILVCIYFLVMVFEVVSFIEIVEQHNVHFSTLYPVVFLPCTFYAICCTYVIMFPLWLPHKSKNDHDLQGRRFRNICVYAGLFLNDGIFLVMHSRMTLLVIHPTDITNIAFYIFMAKDSIMIILISSLAVVVLRMQCINNQHMIDREKNRILHLFFAPSCDVVAEFQTTINGLNDPSTVAEEVTEDPV